MAGDPWTFNVTPARPDGHIYATDGTISVDMPHATVDGSVYQSTSFISGTSVSLELYDDSYPDISFIPQTAIVGSTTAVNFLPTVMYAWSSDNSGTYPSTLYTWTIDVSVDLTDIPYWANYQNGTADDVTSTIVDGNPVWTGADEFEVDGVVYTRDSSKDVVTTTQTVANLSDGTNTYEIEDSQARADIQEIQSNYVTTDTAQTITGLKTIDSSQITDGYALVVKMSGDGTQTTAGNNFNSYFAFNDTNNIRLGEMNLHNDSVKNNLGFAINNPNTGSWGGTLAVAWNKTEEKAYAYCPHPFEDTTSSTQIDTVGARNTKLNSLLSNYVTIDTNQDITSIKTFSGVDVRFKKGSSDLTKQATSAENWVGPRFVDNNNVQGALLQYRRLSTGVAETNIQTRALSTHNFSKIAIYQNPDGTAYTETVIPTEDTTSSTQIDTVGARNTKLAQYVKTTSDQEIDGIKTFIQNPVVKKSSPIFTLKNTDIIRGTAPSANQYIVNLIGHDSVGKSTWGIYHRYYTTRENRVDLICYKGTTTDNSWTGIGVGYDSSGNSYTYAPTPATSDNSTKIATTAYVKAQGYASDSDVVKTSGNQNIGGTKTFTLDIIRKFGTTIDGANHYNTPIIFKDSNGTTTGFVRNVYYSNNSIVTGVQTTRKINGVDKYVSLEVGIKEDGTFFTEAPTPATSDNSTNIATTAFVKNQGYATNSTLSSSPYLVLYGTSTSAADATAKIVEISSSYATTPTISAGQILIVTPTITSTVANSTITVQKSSTTLLAAKTMHYNNANITTSTDSIVWKAHVPSIFVYDGTYWVFAGHGYDENTTYSAMSVSEGTTGTATSSRVMRADYLKQIIEELAISKANTYYDSASSTLYIG